MNHRRSQNWNTNLDDLGKLRFALRESIITSCLVYAMISTHTGLLVLIKHDITLFRSDFNMADTKLVRSLLTFSDVDANAEWWEIADPAILNFVLKQNLPKETFRKVDGEGRDISEVSQIFYQNLGCS